MQTPIYKNADLFDLDIAYTFRYRCLIELVKGLTYIDKWTDRDDENISAFSLPTESQKLLNYPHFLILVSVDNFLLFLIKSLLKYFIACHNVVQDSWKLKLRSLWTA